MKFLLFGLAFFRRSVRATNPFANVPDELDFDDIPPKSSPVDDLDDLGFFFEGDPFEPEVLTDIAPTRRTRATKSTPVLTGSTRGSQAIAPVGFSLDKPKKFIPVEELVPVVSLTIAEGSVVHVEGVGRFKVDKTLYRDAEQSRIYRAYSLEDSSDRVVVKIGYADGITELDREVLALERLVNVEGVVKLIYAPGTLYEDIRGRRFKFVVLDLLGVSLQDLIQTTYEQTGFPANLIAEIAIQTISILQAVHAENLVHGDVRPGNIMLTGERVGLIDFGHARDLTEESKPDRFPKKDRLGGLSLSGLEARTPTPRDDLFSLGEVLMKCVNRNYTHFLGRLIAEVPKRTSMADLAAIILGIKKHFVPSQVSGRNIPGLDEYMQTVQSLGYDELPDYNALMHLFV